MIAAQITAIQPRHKGPVTIWRLGTGENLHDGLEGNVVIVDQDNEVIHGVRRSLGHYSTEKTAIEFVTCSYAQIHSISSYMSYKEFVEVMDHVVSTGTLTEEQKELIVESMAFNK